MIIVLALIVLALLAVGIVSLAAKKQSRAIQKNAAPPSPREPGAG